MTPEYIQRCLLIATLVNGILAGINLDRYIVQVPAFRRVPIEQWMAYARVADLRTGRIWYPLLATISLVSILIAGWLYVNEFTFVAAPTLFQLRGARSEEAGRALFARFHRWGQIRAVCQTLAFATSVWALVLFNPFLVGSSER